MLHGWKPLWVQNGNIEEVREKISRSTYHLTAGLSYLLF
jgi:hypothetical protein